MYLNLSVLLERAKVYDTPVDTTVVRGQIGDF